ncbi:MAG: flippase-like domain-containing protein, partial [Acidobacteria bacterium]|nr:flippase-like domain-containing protein [Acidobacteriota bacterium]
MIRRLAGSLVTRLVITTGILAWMATRIDMGAALRATLAVHVAAVAGVLALVAIDRLVMIWRWVLLLRGTGTSIAFGDAARIFLESSFVGSFLPAGVGGDAARAWSLSRGHARGSVALAS